MVEDEVYVMLMMMRADEGYTPNEKCSLEEMVACALAEDTDACLAACTGNEEGEEEVLPGYAKVSTKAAASQNVALNAVDKKIGTVTLKAGDNDTTVTAIEITKAGLGDAKDVATISLMKNGEYVTNSATLTNKVAKLRFRPNLTLKANGSETFDVVVSMAGKIAGATAGGQHDFSVTAVTVSNGTFGGTPARLGSLTTSNYEISSVATTMDNATVSAGDTDVTITAVTMTPAADATVSSFTLTSNNNNEGLYDVFANIKAYVDNKEVGKVTINEETIVVNGLNEKVEKNDDLVVVLRGDVKYVGTAPSFTLDLEKNHVVATEDSTDERMASAAATATVTMSNGIGLTFKNLTKDTQTVAVNTKDVVLLNLELSAAANIDITNYYVDFGTTAITAAELENIVISIDGNETDIAATDIVLSGTKYVAKFNDKVRDAFSIDANDKVNVKVKADVKSAGTYGPLTFTITSMKNLDTNTPINGLSEGKAGHTTKVNGAGTINVTKGTSAEGTTIKGGEATDILAFNIKAKSEDVTLNTVNFTLTTTLTTDKIDTVELYQGTTKLASLDGDKLTAGINGQFKNLSKDIKADEQLSFSLRVTLTDTVAGDLGKKIQASIAAGDIAVKGKTSKNTIYNTQAINGKEYQVSTSKATVSVEQDGQYIFVTVNNTSAYDMVLSGFVVDIKGNMVNGENVLTNANITSANLLKDTKNGDDITANLANKALAPWKVGTNVIPALVNAQWKVATSNNDGSAASCATLPAGATATDATAFAAPTSANDCAYTAKTAFTDPVAPATTGTCAALPAGATATDATAFAAPTSANDCAYTAKTAFTAAVPDTYKDDGYPVITDTATFVIKMNSATTIDNTYYTVTPDSIQFWYKEDYAEGTDLSADTSIITEKLSD